MKALYKCNKTFLSVPHVVLDKTYIRSSDFVHLLFKEVMCGINDDLESNIRPINLSSLCGVGLELHHALTQVCRKMRLKGGLECKLMLLFCVAIVHTNLYNCVS